MLDTIRDGAGRVFDSMLTKGEGVFSSLAKFAEGVLQTMLRSVFQNAVQTLLTGPKQGGGILGSVLGIGSGGGGQGGGGGGVTGAATSGVVGLLGKLGLGGSKGAGLQKSTVHGDERRRRIPLRNHGRLRTRRRRRRSRDRTRRHSRNRTRDSRNRTRSRVRWITHLRTLQRRRETSSRGKGSSCRSDRSEINSPPLKRSRDSELPRIQDSKSRRI